MNIREKSSKLLFAMCITGLSSPVFGVDVTMPQNQDAQLGGLSSGILLEQRSAQVGIDLKDTKDEIPKALILGKSTSGTGEVIESRQKLNLNFSYGLTPRIGLGLTTSVVKESHRDGVLEPSQKAVPGSTTLRLSFGLFANESFGFALTPFVTEGVGERADSYYSMNRKETYGAHFTGQYKLARFNLPFSFGFRNREKTAVGDIFIGEEIFYAGGLNLRLADSYSLLTKMHGRQTRVLDAKTPISSSERDYIYDAEGTLGLAMHTDSALIKLSGSKPLVGKVGLSASRTSYQFSYAIKLGNNKGKMEKKASKKETSKKKTSKKRKKKEKKVISEFEKVRQRLLREAEESEKQLGIQEEVEAELEKIRKAENIAADARAKKEKAAAQKKLQNELADEKAADKKASSVRAQIENDLGEEYIIEASDLEWDGI